MCIRLAGWGFAGCPGKGAAGCRVWSFCKATRWIFWLTGRVTGFNVAPERESAGRRWDLPEAGSAGFPPTEDRVHFVGESRLAFFSAENIAFVCLAGFAGLTGRRLRGARTTACYELQWGETQPEPLGSWSKKNWLVVPWDVLPAQGRWASAEFLSENLVPGMF